MKSMKRYIALFYVALILLVKVAGLHVLTHDTDAANIQHCEVCLVETVANFTPLIGAETPAIPEAVYYFSELERATKTPHVNDNNSYLGSYHSTRPPPQIL